MALTLVTSHALWYCAGSWNVELLPPNTLLIIHLHQCIFYWGYSNEFVLKFASKGLLEHVSYQKDHNYTFYRLCMMKTVGRIHRALLGNSVVDAIEPWWLSQLWQKLCYSDAFNRCDLFVDIMCSILTQCMYNHCLHLVAYACSIHRRVMSIEKRSIHLQQLFCIEWSLSTP